MTSCACSLFVNTGLMLMFTNANFDGTFLENIIPVKNQYNDYVADWYRDIGYSLQSTMFVNALMPYVGFLVSYSIRKF